MRKKTTRNMLKLAAWPLLLGMAALLPACNEKECTKVITYYDYQPVVMNVEDLRSSFSVEPGRAIQDNYKIYVYENYLLVSEPGVGIHVIDNSNPSSPVPVSLLNIPGNHDMTVRNGMLYADNAMDLLVIDLSNPSSPALQQTVHDVVPGYQVNGDGDVMVNYVALKEPKKVVVPCDYDENELSADGTMRMNADPGSSTNAIPGGASEKGGSLARFAAVGNHLYIATGSEIIPVDISNPQQPAKGQSVRVVNTTRNVETLYAYEGNLYVGTPDGMLIYSLNNPTSPQFQGNFRHATSCDPVVVEGTTAYVTLRTGTQCEGFINRLDVVDVSNINSPRMIGTFNMTNPHGMGIDKGVLFLCDGKGGVKAFDASNPYQVGTKMLSHVQGIEAYDAIPNKGVLVVTAKGGIYQYDYSNPSELKLLSSMMTGR